MGWRRQVNSGLDMLGIFKDDPERLKQVDSICFACTMKPGAAAPAAARDAPTASGQASSSGIDAAGNVAGTPRSLDQDRLRIDMCDQLIAIVSFKDGQNIGVRSVAKDVNVNADGMYAMTDKFFAGELKDNLFVGTRDYVKAAMAGPHEYDAKKIAAFMPTSAVLTATSAVLQAGYKSPFFDVFKVLPLPFDVFSKEAGVFIAAAIDIQASMTVGAAIHKADKTLARAVLSLPLEEFQKLIQQEKDAANAEYLQINSGAANQTTMGMDQRIQDSRTIAPVAR